MCIVQILNRGKERINNAQLEMFGIPEFLRNKHWCFLVISVIYFLHFRNGGGGGNTTSDLGNFVKTTLNQKYSSYSYMSS